MTADTPNALQQHPIYQVANDLGSFLGLEKDWIAFSEILSLFAGRMATPINVDIVSDQWTLDLTIADRIASLVGDRVVPIDTYKEFRAEERRGFAERDVLWFRRDYPRLHQDLVGFMARAADSAEGAPSIWRIQPGFVEPSANSPTLRLIASSTHRKLDGFAASFASNTGNPTHRIRLVEVIETLCPRVRYSFPLRDQVSGSLAPSLMLIVERLLQLFANIRRILTDFRTDRIVTAEDYEAVRTLLVNLPLVPVDRIVSADAIETAERIHAHVYAGDHQLALPDHSSEGHHWFTRKHVVKWTQLGYTTAKKHLNELEDDGLVVSTVDRNNRERGRIIYYRFAEDRAPPFDWTNPFAALPPLKVD